MADWFSDPGAVEMAGQASRMLAEVQFDRNLLVRELEQVLLEAGSGETTH